MALSPDQMYLAVLKGGLTLASQRATGRNPVGQGSQRQGFTRVLITV